MADEKSAAPYAPGPELDAALSELESVDRAATSAPWTNSEGRRFRSEEGVDEGWQTADQERDEAAACLSRNALPRLIATIRAMTARDATARKLLKQIEWSARVIDPARRAHPDPEYDMAPGCPNPECEAAESEGHEPGCELAAFLEGKPPVALTWTQGRALKPGDVLTVNGITYDGKLDNGVLTFIPRKP